METNSKFDQLSATLFDSENQAKDIKIMPGSDETKSVETVAMALLESMERVGIVKNNNLVKTK